MQPTAMKVFISYESSEGHLAGCLRSKLDAEGFQCFVAHDDIAVSEEWRERIWDELKTCDCFVGLISAKSVDSHYCVQEIAVALALLPKERFVLAQLDETVPPGFAKSVQAVSLCRVLKQFDHLHLVRENRVNVMIERLGAARSFDEARKLGRPLLDHLSGLNPTQLRRLIHLGMSNSQVWDEASVIGPAVTALFAKFKQDYGEEEAKRVRLGLGDDVEVMIATGGG